MPLIFNDIYTVLIADDDEDDIEMLHEALLAADPLLNVMIAKSGKDALRYLQTESASDVFHLIILDYNMPDITGAEVLGQIIGNDRLRLTPKVVWSTSNSEFYQKRCRDNGATAFFQKPMSMRGLNEVAREMLALTKRHPSE